MPTLKEIEEKVIEITSKQLNIEKEKITPESSFINDLGADSLDTVELIMAIEDAFDLSIPDDAAEKIQTIADAVKYIEEQLRIAGKA
jgi:acyl carrier protein